MNDLISRVTTQIVNPAIGIMIAVAVCFFVYGVIEMIDGADNEEKRTVGRTHMIWGIIGLFIMVSVFGLMQIICGTLELSC